MDNETLLARAQEEVRRARIVLNATEELVSELEYAVKCDKMQKRGECGRYYIPVKIGTGKPI